MPLALDQVAGSITLAVGMRQLLSSYSGSLVRCTNHSGPDLDYGILNGAFDRPTLDQNTALWTSVIKFYDQSGNSRDMPVLGANVVGVLRAQPLQATLGKRQLCDSATSDGNSYTWKTGDVIGTTEGTILYVGSVNKAANNVEPPPVGAFWQNGVMFGDGGYGLSLGVRHAGAGVNGMSFTVQAYGWDGDGTGNEFGAESPNHERYAYIAIAARYQNNLIQLSVNGGDWIEEPFFTFSNTWLFDNQARMGFATQGNEFHNGEAIASNVALSDSVISDWFDETYEYWVGEGSTVALKRVGVGGGNIG